MTNSERDAEFQVVHPRLDNLTSYLGGSSLKNVVLTPAPKYDPVLTDRRNMGGKVPKFGPGIRAHVKVLRANGLGMQAIARKLKMSLSTVYQIVHE